MLRGIGRSRSVLESGPFGHTFRSPRISGEKMKTKIFAAAIFLAIIATIGIAPPIFAQDTVPDNAPYKDPKLPTDQRVKDLISRMTLEEKAAQVGHTAPAIPRLGVPEYNWWNEGLHGVARAGLATVFPQAIGLGAAWDEDMQYRM